MGANGQNRWFASLPLVIVTVALIVIALNALTGARSSRAPMREALFDYYQRLKPAPATASSRIHVVLIDNESLSSIGPWPWPRTIMAQVVDEAVKAGASGVLIADPMDVPDPLSPETIGEFWLQGAQDQELEAQLALLPRTNEVLARSLSRLPAGVGVAADMSSILNTVERQRADISLAKDRFTLMDDDIRYLGLPIAREHYKLSPALSAAATPTVLALPADNEGLVRRSFLVWSMGQKPIPSIGLEAARLALSAQTIEVTPEKTDVTADGHTPSKVTLGETEIDLDSGGSLRLYPQRRTSIATTSAAKLLDGSAARAPLKNTIVMIGRDGQTSNSVRTSRGTVAPIMVQAMVADQLVNGITLKRPVWVGYFEAIAVMLLGAGAIMAAQRIQFWQAMATAAGASVLLIALSAIAFISASLLINPLLPALAMFVGIFSIAGGKSVGTVLLDDNMRSSFKGMLPETAMRALRNDKNRTILEGVHRKISVLACELRITNDDLESLSENPEDVARIMAAATHNLRNTIVSIGGTVDQAEGGRIFAYFNAPLETADHVEKACAAALAMIESMDKTNSELAASKRTKNVQVHLAIGIATSMCHVGPMGHGRSNRYSALGPAVDLASFLRRQSEYYGPAIICDEHVYRDCHHKFAFLELDRLDTSHADRPINIHALIGNPFIKSGKSFRELDASHRAMIQAYRAGNAEAARAELETIRKFPAAKIALFDIYEERIKALSTETKPAGWDGVHQPVM